MEDEDELLAEMGLEAEEPIEPPTDFESQGTAELGATRRETGNVGRVLQLGTTHVNVDPSGQRPDVSWQDDFNDRMIELRETESTKDPRHTALRMSTLGTQVASPRRVPASQPAATPLDAAARVIDPARRIEQARGLVDRIRRRRAEGQGLQDQIGNELQEGGWLAGMQGAASATTAGLPAALGTAASPDVWAGRVSPGDEYRRLHGEIESDYAQAEREHPEQFGAGEAAGTLALGAGLPAGPASTLGRAGAGAAYGALLGAGSSDAGSAMELAGDAGEGAALGTATTLAGEVPRRWLRQFARAAPDWATRRAEDLTRAELNARGIWSPTDTEAARRFPGGREGLVAELNRLDAPLRAEQIPAWARQQADIIGPRVEDSAEALTRRGAAVNMPALSDRVEELARGAERRTGGQPVAQHLRTQVRDQWRRGGNAPEFGAEGPTGAPTPFREAWDERQWIDELAPDLPAQGLGRATGRLAEARRMLSGEMQSVAEATDPALAREWANANRDYSVPAFLLSHGRGAERLNTMGGGAGMISRAVGAGQLLYGNPMGAVEAVAGPALQQELRMRMPGAQTRYLRRLVPALRSMGPRAMRWANVLDRAARRGPMALSAAHYAMSRRDPEYRQAAERVRGASTEDEDALLQELGLEAAEE